jgi:type II secretory pathway pseudopilin PulG
VKRKITGFTIVELLAALGIIALLLGLLLPALSMVRNSARETKQKAQFATIEMALTAFKNDYGDYPPSGGRIPPGQYSDYCGAQKLTEALVGWDLLGFHPKSAWRADGYDATGGHGSYDPDRSRDDDGDNNYDTFDERKGSYLELASANVFRLGNVSGNPGLFNNTYPLAPNTFVLCDAFGATRIRLANGKTVKAGAPILYYKANTSAKALDAPDTENNIYNPWDSEAIVVIKARVDGDINFRLNRLGDSDNQRQYFYNYITDPKITAKPWPYRPDSFILISAGSDGYYGTDDDIRNFGN